MNSKKYKDSLYSPREINDLRELIKGSKELYGQKAAFLVKDDHKKPYRAISFNHWDGEVDALGTSFMKMGLKGKKIAVLGENSYKWVVTYFATVNGVGVIVPIDRELKPAEIANLLNRASVSALVHSQKLSKKVDEVMPLLDHALEYRINMDLAPDQEEQENQQNSENQENPKAQGGIISFDRLLKEGKMALVEDDRSFVDAEIDRDAMCSLLFTSGTTGLAKGVMLSHRNLASNVYNMSKYVDVSDYVGLSVLPMHHSYEMTCHIFTGLYQGFCAAICEGLKYIMPNMVEAKCTIMLAVPLIYENIHRKIMMQAKKSGQYKKLRAMIAVSKKLRLYNHPKICKKIFKSIHEKTGGHIVQFIAGGAAMDPDIAADFEAMGFPFIQGYGMTENAPIIAVNKDRYSRHDAAGLPMPDTEIRIDDADATGIGEIVCKGPSVMIGYYGNPEATAETLTEDGWLKTGDYGYFDDDGFLHVSGRKKNVIITKNGKNVFPEEVEYYLLQSDFIAEALVHSIDKGREGGDIIIKAEIFPDFMAIEMNVGQQDEEELRALIRDEIDKANENMPSYKQVRRFDIRYEEFSKTTTRKIKRYTEVNMNEGEGEKC